MKKTFRLIFLCLIIVLSGCSFFGSSEAEILSYTTDGVVKVEIYPATTSVKVIVEPMSLTDFSPQITISDKAVLTTPETIEDGIPATYTVSAQNGESVDWKITVEVQHGLSMKIDGKKYILTSGFIHDDLTISENYGNGTPPVSSYETYVFGIVPAKVYDLAIQPVVDFDWFDWILINNEISSTTGACIFSNSQDNSDTEFDMTATITRTGEIGEIFSADFSAAERNGTKKITEGFLKLKYIKEMLESESAERLL